MGRLCPQIWFKEATEQRKLKYKFVNYFANVPFLIVFIFSPFFRFHDVPPIIILQIIFPTTFIFFFNFNIISSPFLILLSCQYLNCGTILKQGSKKFSQRFTHSLQRQSDAQPFVRRITAFLTFSKFTTLCQLIKMVNERCLWKMFPVSFRRSLFLSLIFLTKFRAFQNSELSKGNLIIIKPFCCWTQFLDGFRLMLTVLLTCKEKEKKSFH